MSTLPWVDAWRDEPSDSALDAAVERPAQPIDAGEMSPQELAEIFAANAGEIFLCDTQNRALLRHMLDAGRAHAKLNFLSVAGFDQRVAKDDPWIVLPKYSLGISGLSGVGKTSFLQAMDRLMASRRSWIDTVILGNLPLDLMRYARVRDAGSVADILEQLLEDRVEPEGNLSNRGASNYRAGDVTRRVAKVLKKLVRVRTYRDGVIIIGLDELQFGSNGDACAWITSLVLQLMGYGPLVVYVTNFSLMHKLSAGNHEVRRRLLTNVIEMLPYSSANADWQRFLAEVMRILPEAWAFAANDVGEAILRFTYGIRDNAVALLREALIIARTEHTGSKVAEKHIEQAYRSASYAARRDDVEALLSHGQLRKRKDLYSPLAARHLHGRDTGRTSLPSSFPGPSAGGSPGLPKVVVAEAAIREQNARVIDAMHEEQMQKPKRQEIERVHAQKRARTSGAAVFPIRSSGGSRKLADIIAAAADLVDE